MLTVEQIEAADRMRGEGRFHATPLHFPASLNTRIARGGGRIYLKLELFQRTGSFKVRGATAKVLSLSNKERACGIIAASAGNHAQGVALAASAIGVRARIVMPEYAPLTKREATAGYGAEVILKGATYDEAYAHALELRDADGGTLIHAFDDEQIMAGQGTIGLEILRDLPDVETVICPVGGGGLISG
ncbi:MAG: pyridoxal-phosphate dependent enzyme, partial [Planctomycetota bacterium]|nr:pyridoxal-phosphate dependent enzyme [Planctomycetota bacterium]